MANVKRFKDFPIFNLKIMGIILMVADHVYQMFQLLGATIG